MKRPKSAGELALVRSIAPADRIADDAHEGRMVAAYVTMTGGAKCRPGGRRRWLLDKAIAGAYRPCANIQEMQDAVIRDGRATLAQATAWMLPLHARAVAMIAARDGAALPAWKDCHRAEQASNHTLDDVQLEVMANPTRADLERVITLAQAQIDATTAVRDRAAVELRAMDEQRGQTLGRLGLDAGRAS